MEFMIYIPFVIVSLILIFGLYEVNKHKNHTNFMLYTCIVCILITVADIFFGAFGEYSGRYFSLFVLVGAIAYIGMAIYYAMKTYPSPKNIKRDTEQVLAFFLSLPLEQKVRFVDVARIISRGNFDYETFVVTAMDAIRRGSGE